MTPDDWLWYGIWIDTCDISHFRACKWRICITYKRSPIWESQLVRRPSIWRDCRAKAVTTCNHPCSNTDQPCTLHSALHSLHPFLMSWSWSNDQNSTTKNCYCTARCHQNIQKGWSRERVCEWVTLLSQKEKVSHATSQGLIDFDRSHFYCHNFDVKDFLIPFIPVSEIKCWIEFFRPYIELNE